MTDNVSHLPEPGVALDLDAEERDPKDVKPPFVVKINGRNITFKDPAEIDWQDLADMDHPVQLIRLALQDEDRKHIASANLPAWKFNKLMEGYSTHYDLEQKVADAKRQARFNAL